MKRGSYSPVTFSVAEYYLPERPFADAPPLPDGRSAEPSSSLASDLPP